MKHANSVYSEAAAVLMAAGPAWSLSACTHSAMNADANVGTHAPQVAATHTPSQYFGDQFAAQERALQAKPDEAPLETF